MARQKWSFVPTHKNLKQVCLTFSNIPLGIQANDIQYTRIASRTDLTKISLPTLDNHLKLQAFSLFPILQLANTNLPSCNYLVLDENPSTLDLHRKVVVQREDILITISLLFIHEMG
jgi:hypothetical protein